MKVNPNPIAFPMIGRLPVSSSYRRLNRRQFLDTVYISLQPLRLVILVYHTEAKTTNDFFEVLHPGKSVFAEE